MATTIPSPAIVPVTPVFTNTEGLALAGFLAGYSRPDPPVLRAGPAAVRQLVPAELKVTSRLALRGVRRAVCGVPHDGLCEILHRAGHPGLVVPRQELLAGLVP